MVDLAEEIEALTAIYLDELEIQFDDNSGLPCNVSIQVHPATADNTDARYVFIWLSIDVSENYPEIIPNISIKNSRGLSDQDLKSILAILESVALERKGGPMLYEIIELAKEQLTVSNKPHDECAVCLYGFINDDVFTKTECYHYFHQNCLARYIDHSLEQMRQEAELEENGEKSSHLVEVENTKQIVCPVCRLPIVWENIDAWRVAPEPRANDNAGDSLDSSRSVSGYTPDTDMQRVQEKMARLFEKQKKSGGIIDLEWERNKYLVTLDQPYGYGMPSTSKTDSGNHHFYPEKIQEPEDLLSMQREAAARTAKQNNMHKNTALNQATGNGSERRVYRKSLDGRHVKSTQNRRRHYNNPKRSADDTSLSVADRSGICANDRTVHDAAAVPSSNDRHKHNNVGKANIRGDADKPSGCRNFRGRDSAHTHSPYPNKCGGSSSRVSKDKNKVNKHSEVRWKDGGGHGITQHVDHAARIVSSAGDARKTIPPPPGFS